MSTRKEKLELLKLLEEKNNRLLKKSYIDYVEHVHRGQWKRGKHLEYLCSKIELLLRNDLITDAGNKAQILIVSMPPQHGKSQCVTETLPCWYLGNNPNKRVIIVSYNTDFARRFGRRNIAKISEFGKDIFRLELSKMQDDEFEVKGYSGSCISRGIMSGITGNPGDLIIIDDPVKNREEADSETYREKMWDEYLNSVKTRLSATGKIILIQTRWHEDDLAGRIINAEANKTVVINFSCEAEANDILGRQQGDALFPEIGKDRAWLDEFKHVYLNDPTAQGGQRAWLALFQGRPSALEGNMLKRSWWQYYDMMPDKFDRMCLSIDCTFKDSDTSDFVVIQAWGMIGIDCYLLDQIRARMDFPSTLQAIESAKNRWQAATRIFIEDKANGSAVIQILQKKISGIIPVEPEGGKVARVSAVSAHIETGHVYLPRFAEFTNILLDECSSFPNGTHDDCVDAMSQAINRMMYYRNIEKAPDNFVNGGTYARGELRAKGYKDYEINRMVKEGQIKLIGR